MCRSAKSAPRAAGELLRRAGRYGDFIGCENYPKCKYTRPITLGIKCPKCNEGEFVRRGTSQRTRQGPHLLRMQPVSRLRFHHAARADQRAVPEVRRAVRRGEAHQARKFPRLHSRKLRLGRGSAAARGRPCRRPAAGGRTTAGRRIQELTGIDRPNLFTKRDC